MKSGDMTLGQVYRCPVCGAELSVIRPGKGGLSPVCCNKRTVLLARINPVYHCPICGSELMVIRGGEGRPEPICCNQRMNLKAV